MDLLSKLLNRQRWAFELRYWRRRTPWDTQVTPPEVVAYLKVSTPGRALDLGCGTGTNAMALAERGWQVTGVDFAPKAIGAARRRAVRAGLQIELLVGDVTDLDSLSGPYDLALDIGCLHGVPKERRQAYAQGLTRLVRPGGTYMLYAQFPRGGDYGVAPDEVPALFSPGWSLARQEIGQEKGHGSAWYWLHRQ